MPEYVELVSSCQLAKHWFDHVKDKSDLCLKNIYINTSKAEEKSSKIHPLAKEGLPYPLAAGSKVKRGPRLAQEAVSITDATFHLTGVTFDPGRFAHFVEAFYCHVACTHEKVWDLVKPFLRGNFFISVRNSDRLAYTSWLAVHGKDQTNILKRLRIQYNDLMTWLSNACEDKVPRCCDSESGFFDLVEPSFLKAGLEKDHNLGELIFGHDIWVAYSGKLWISNILTAYFKRRGIDVSQPKYLHPTVTSYNPLFFSGEQLRKSWLETTLHYTNDKSLWSVIPQLPSNTHPTGYSTYDPFNEKGKGRRKSNGPPTITAAPRHEKEKQLFNHIVNYSINYAVGPLDYCGIAHIQHNKVILCRNDPQVSKYLCDRLEQGIRRRQHLQPGTQKVANPKAFKRKRRDVEAESTHHENQHPPAAPAKVKCTCTSIDSTKQDEEIIANFDAVSKHLLSFNKPVSELEGVDHLIPLELDFQFSI
ncbi:hypothetical protein K443DRAFT_8420 [Laccaria amethystina LaAM-08-1]|uniref:Uncharacterized protein n=1 Tax=Laccaria amethystina LaAM-08-1 TaxID=1095629 RepID=A0A0C9WNY4_9AGAR|nr:hypothetical protein K443DRAFT_8420 [Laccaria amethystina LaAM-08-1]